MQSINRIEPIAMQMHTSNEQIGDLRVVVVPEVLMVLIIGHELPGGLSDAAEGSAHVGGRHALNVEGIRRAVQPARLVLFGTQRRLRVQYTSAQALIIRVALEYCTSKHTGKTHRKSESKMDIESMYRKWICVYRKLNSTLSVSGKTVHKLSTKCIQ